MKRDAFCEGWEFSRDGGPFEAVIAPRGSLLFNLAAQASGTGMTMLANAPGADALGAVTAVVEWDGLP